MRSVACFSLVARQQPEEQLALFVKLAFIACALSCIPTFQSSQSVPSLTALTARVSLTSLAVGGDAVGRLADGRVVFVPGGAPDEVVDVSLDELKKGYVRATLRKVVRPSPHRVTPACLLAAPGRCGGCPLMHISASAQREAKQDWVMRAVRHSGAEVLPLLTPTPALGYRIRAKLGVVSGQLTFALSRSNQRQLVPSCAVLRKELSQVLFGPLEKLLSFVGTGGTVAALYGTSCGQSAVHLAVELGEGGQRSEALKELRVLVDAGVLAGGVLDDAAIGETMLQLDDDGAPLCASADGFAQASEAGHTVLPKLVRDAVRQGFAKPPSVLELYAGSGNLTRALCSTASQVVSIEGEPRAAARLAQLQKQLANLSVLASPVEKALPQVIRRQPAFDVVVLDPPRGGARSIVEQLGTLRARRLVYVSCDAMTLGRDLVELGRHGFAPRTVLPIDLMPQTAEVECIAILDSR